MSEILGTGVKSEIGFNDIDTHADKLAADQAVNEPDAGATSQEVDGGQTTSDGGQTSGWDTGIEGIKANGEKGGLPVFDVTPEEFYRNMKLDRRKLVFNRGTPAQQYHARTNYKQHFYIRNKADGFIKRVGTDLK